MTPASKKRVLFVCIGNSCRSQMAEGFARMYGADVLVPASAGVMPAASVAPDTAKAMLEKNINLRDHFPKHIRQLGRARFDLIVNMSGSDLDTPPGDLVGEWDVPDPIRFRYDRHCEIRDEIERLVMKLVLDIRRRSTDAPLAGQS
jgi:arsenate reductase (thioredoxin)